MTALKLFLIIVLCTYAIGGYLAGALLGHASRRAVPLFSWFLFTTTPNHVVAYAVRIHEYQGRVFNPPLDFITAEGIIARPESAKARSLINELGKNLEAGNEETADELRRAFELAFIPAPMRYEIVRLDYDPIVRWRSGTIRMTPLRQFTVAGQLP